MEKALLIAMLSVFSLALRAQTATDSKLTGQIIYGPEPPALGHSENYAFDGNWTTSYKAAYKYEDRNESWYWPHNNFHNQHHAWVGYDFGEGQKRVITQVKWVNCSGPYSNNVISDMGWSRDWYCEFTLPYSCTAVFEGANQPDFSDAVPLYLVTDDSNTQSQHSADVHVSRAFRYVRYMGPVGSQCQIAELEFYGHEGEGDDTQFYQPTNLPVVIVHTKETVLTQSNGNVVTFEAGTNPPEDHLVYPNDYERDAVFTFLSQEGKKIVTSEGSFRERGNASRYYGKRPYRVKLAKKSKVFSSNASAKKWTLVPAMDDKSLMRNILGYNVYERLGAEYTPYCRPVDLFVNGEYVGQYQFCDQIEVNKNRVNIEEIEPTATDATGAPIAWPSDAMSDFGWFTEIDAQVDEDGGTAHEATGSWFHTHGDWRIPVTIKSPDGDENVAAYTNSFRDHFDNLLNAIQKNERVEEYLDLTSFARHFIAVEFVGNTDGYRSINMYKHKGDSRLFTGPLWDLNLAFNNDYRIGDLNKCSDWTFNQAARAGSDHWVNAGDIKKVLQALFAKPNPKTNELPAVMKEVRDIWASARQTGAISREALLAEVDALKEKLNASQAINYKRWDYLGYRCFYEPAPGQFENNIDGALPGTWEGEVDIVRNCIAGRVDWMDNQVWANGAARTASKEITISSARWATIYLPHAFAVPEGLTCYEVTGLDGDLLKLKAVDNTEANKPYLLNGDPGNYILEGYAGGYMNDPSRGERTLGLLTGVAVSDDAKIGTYVLQNHNGRVCFYRVYEGSGARVNAERAYLTLPEAASAAPIRFYLDDEENALSEMALAEEHVQIYDMSGKLISEVSENTLTDKLNQLGRGIYVVRSGNVSRKVTINVGKGL